MNYASNSHSPAVEVWSYSSGGNRCNVNEFCSTFQRKPGQKVNVVSIIGEAGEGKSHALNHLFFGGSPVFPTNQSPRKACPCIWAALSRGSGSDPSTLVFEAEGLPSSLFSGYESVLAFSKSTNALKIQAVRVLTILMSISDVIVYRKRCERLQWHVLSFVEAMGQVIARLRCEANMDATNPNMPSVVIFHETRWTYPLSVPFSSRRGDARQVDPTAKQSVHGKRCLGRPSPSRESTTSEEGDSTSVGSPQLLMRNTQQRNSSPDPYLSRQESRARRVHLSSSEGKQVDFGSTENCPSAFSGSQSAASGFLVAKGRDGQVLGGREKFSSLTLPKLVRVLECASTTGGDGDAPNAGAHLLSLERSFSSVEYAGVRVGEEDIGGAVSRIIECRQGQEGRSESDLLPACQSPFGFIHERVNLALNNKRSHSIKRVFDDLLELCDRYLSSVPSGSTSERAGVMDNNKCETNFDRKRQHHNPSILQQHKRQDRDTIDMTQFHSAQPSVASPNLEVIFRCGGRCLACNCQCVLNRNHPSIGCRTADEGCRFNAGVNNRVAFCRSCLENRGVEMQVREVPETKGVISDYFGKTHTLECPSCGILKSSWMWSGTKSALAAPCIRERHHTGQSTQRGVLSMMTQLLYLSSSHEGRPSPEFENLVSFKAGHLWPCQQCGDALPLRYTNAPSCKRCSETLQIEAEEVARRRKLYELTAEREATTSGEVMLTKNPLTYTVGTAATSQYDHPKNKTGVSNWSSGRSFHGHVVLAKQLTQKYNQLSSISAGATQTLVKGATALNPMASLGVMVRE
eukprot:GHVN01005416.1.p1 GENE.GHVN01005416.1~~GHVN01005416.1.p1  ORF type:complete len:867 (-),score=83.19 GHVN01005416.1:2248-4650(-)